MNKTNILLVSAGCALSLIAGGCTKDAQTVQSQPGAVVTAPTATGPTACQVFNAELAGKYLGEVGAPNENNSPLVSNCTYSSTAGGITLLIKQSNAIEQEGAITASKDLSGVDPEMVEGLGDKAYWSGGKLNQLNVFKGNDWYIISAFMPGYGKDKAIEIMKDCLANS